MTEDLLITEERSGPRKVLHVGCGSSDLRHMPTGFQDGRWEEVRFDIDPTFKPDIIGTLLDMEGVESGSMDAVYSSHSIEHVHWHEVAVVLKEFRRVLKPDGFAVITCPDIQQVAQYVTKGNLTGPLYQSPNGPITALDIMYGHSGFIADGMTYMAHKTGFTLKTLIKCLQDAGFSVAFGKKSPKEIALWTIGYVCAVTEEEGKALFGNYTSCL